MSLHLLWSLLLDFFGCVDSNKINSFINNTIINMSSFELRLHDSLVDSFVFW